jgi:hypothetical protein
MPKCRLCNDFQRSARQFRLAFDCSQKELIQSANGRCIICSFLLEGLQHFEPKLEALQGHDRIHIWGGNIDGGGAVEMEVFSGGALRLRLEFFNTKGKTSVLQGARMLPTIPGDTRAPASIEWARQRLQECVDSHASCGQESIPELPTRVLDLRPDADDMMNVKLIRTQGLDARYACLNHRWSRPAALETLKSNYVAHTKGIGWDVLPKTFIEAIAIAQDLDLRYLWIDSLCIIQDDEDDKSHEIAKMSSTYTNAYITIAATHSDSSMHGCYSTGSLHHQDYRLPSSKQHGAITVETDLYVREKIAHIGEERALTPLLKRGWVCQERLLSPRVLHFCEKELIWECRESSSCQCSCFKPLIRLKKGYMEVFRRSTSINNNNVPMVDTPTFSLWNIENLVLRDDGSLDTIVLPPSWAPWFRVGDDGRFPMKLEIVRREWMHRHNLRHTSQRVTRALKSGIVHYQDVRNRESLLKSGSRRKNNDDSTAPDLATNESDARPRILFDSKLEYIHPQKLNDEAIRKWRYIVSDYTDMNLTNPRDRLPAIAGVATQFERLMGGRYLAGLWESALPGDLLWRMDRSAQYTQQYRAPTWSWASIEGKVKYYKMTSYNPEFSIVRALCDPLSKINPFGEVASGSLEVNAIAADLEFSLDLFKDKARSRQPIRVEFMRDTALFIPDCDLTMSAAPLHVHAHDSHHLDYRFLCIGDFNVERTDATVIESRSDPGMPLAVSLVVHRVDEGKYKRVGILERYRVNYPKEVGSPRNDPDAAINRYVYYLKQELDSQLQDRRHKNSQAQSTWKSLKGLVLI